MSSPGLQVQCPGCRRVTPYDGSNRWRPFCSERCRNGDLGAWASEAYRVSAQDPPDTQAPGPDLPAPRH